MAVRFQQTSGFTRLELDATETPNVAASSWTMSGWIYRPAGDGGRIWEDDSEITNFVVNDNTTCTFFVTLADSAGQYTADGPSGSIPDDTWTHVAFGIDRTGGTGNHKIFLYIDGVLTDETAIADNALLWWDKSFMGARWNGVEPFDGRVDALGWWDRVLTGAEITWLAGGAQSRKFADLGDDTNDGELLPTNLLGWWDFADGADFLNDATAANRDWGDIGTNAATWVLGFGESTPSTELTLAEPVDAGCVDIASSTIDDTNSLIFFQPRLTHASSHWWYYGTVGNTDGRTLTLDIPRASSWNTLINTCRHGFWSYSVNGPWNDWDSQTFVSTPDRIRFTKTTPFDQDTVHVAYYPVYTWAKIESQVAAWKLSDYVHPTTSGDANLVVGTTAERSNGFGRTCPAANLYGFRIEDEAEVGSKNVCLLINGNHPGEHNAAHCFDEAIELLLSADPRAEFLRKHWIFYVYPDVNPQGRYGGLYRNAPDALTEDYNRIWNTTDSGTQVTVKTAIDVDVGLTGIHACIDFHSYNFDYAQASDLLDIGFVDDDAALEHPAWLTRMRAYDNQWSYIDLSATGLAVQWAATNLDNSGSVKLALGAENGSTLAFGMAEYRRYGRRLIYALADATEQGLFPVQADHLHAGVTREAYSGYRT